MQKKSYILLIVLTVVALIAAAVFIFLELYNAPQRRVDRHLEAAKQYVSQKEYDSAIAECRAAIAIDPLSAKAYRSEGWAYIRKAEELEMSGDMEGALAVVAEAQTKLDQGYRDTQSKGVEERMTELNGLAQEIQNPDFEKITKELIQITEEWEYYYKRAALEERTELMTLYAERFQKYIALYEMVNGTDECTCGPLQIENVDFLNENGYFDLGKAYDHAIFFRLGAGDEDTAWNLRNALAKRSGAEGCLEGFETTYSYFRENTGDMFIWMITEENDSSGCINRDWISLHCNGTQTYDRFGRMISKDCLVSDDQRACVEYCYENGIERKIDRMEINDVMCEGIQDITAKRNVSMDNLLMAFVQQEQGSDDCLESHGNDRVLYVFKDGSVYCANEYYDDYYDKEDLSERCYLRNSDDMWAQLEDWIYLGKLPASDMKILSAKVDAIDESKGSEELYYYHDWPIGDTRVVQRKQNAQWSKKELNNAKELMDGMGSERFGATFRVYKDSGEYTVYAWKEWGDRGSYFNLSEDDVARDIMSYVLQSDVYNCWNVSKQFTGQRAHVVYKEDQSIQQSMTAPVYKLAPVGIDGTADWCVVK